MSADQDASAGAAAELMPTCGSSGPSHLSSRGARSVSQAAGCPAAAAWAGARAASCPNSPWETFPGFGETGKTSRVFGEVARSAAAGTARPLRGRTPDLSRRLLMAQFTEPVATTPQAGGHVSLHASPTLWRVAGGLALAHVVL